MLEKKILKVSVRTLVEETRNSGDLSLRSGELGDPVEGIRAHQRIQDSREPDYLKEVAVSHCVENDDFILEIRGRVDGILASPTLPVIEEIKTTRRSLDAFEEEEGPIHWAQVQVYGYLWCIRNSLHQAAVQVTYCHLDSNEIRERRRTCSREQLEALFNNIADRYLQWRSAIETWRRERDESIQSLGFPFPSYRPGQRQMAVQVFRALREREDLLIQAPTGIGKTIAALFPGVKAIREGHIQKILYLTARTTGKSIAEQAFQRMWKAGLRFKAVTMTARDKICGHPAASCDGEECGFSKGFYERIGGAMQEFFLEDDFNRSSLEGIALRHRVCPFALSQRLALWADGVICDYNHALDPVAALKRLSADEDETCCFVIDEAHNLVDRAREMFSAQLSRGAFVEFSKAARGSSPQLERLASKVLSWFRKQRDRCRLADGSFSDLFPPDSLLPRLNRFLTGAEDCFLRPALTSADFRKRLLELYFQVHAFMRAASHFNQNYAACYESGNGDLRVRLFCIDPSQQLKESFKRCQAAIFLSATLTPVDYFRKILGCNDTAWTLVLPPVFPPANLCLLLADRVSTRFRERQATREEVARLLAAFVSRKAGNYLLFFPSYEYLRMVCEEFAPLCPEARLIIQSSAMTEEERLEFLTLFETGNSRTLVGLAVLGGAFAEGIDLVGERLAGAAVVGVGLPGICMERDLIRDYFQNRLGAGFDYAYRVPGIHRVLQAAGRVVRSEQDRGAVLLLDQRFSAPGYRDLLPAEWNPVRVAGSEGVMHSLDRFWKAPEPAAREESA